MASPYRTRRAQTTRTLVATVAIAGVASLVAPSARASGFIYSKFGGDDAQPAIASPYSVYFNPAAIGGAEGTQLVVDAMLGYRTAKYERPTSALSNQKNTDPKYIDANSGTAKTAGVQGAPYLGITTDFGGGLPIFAGFATYVPEGGMATFDHRDKFKNDPLAAGAYDGVQRWALITGKQISWWNTLAVGATIKPARLSIGLSASVVYDILQSLIARNQDPSDQLTTPTGVPTEGRSLLDVSGTHLALAGGLYWRDEADRFRVGASYTSAQGLGAVRLKGSLDTQFGNRTPQRQDADVVQRFPDIIRLGAAYRATSALDLRLDFEWVRWSSFDNQCIVQAGNACNLAANGSEIVPAGGSTKVLLNFQRNWKDAFALRAAAHYKISPQTTVGGSIGFDTSAVPSKQLDATYIDAFKLLFSATIKQQLSDRLYLRGTLTAMPFLSVDNSKDAVLYTNAIPSRSASNGGTYTSMITFADVALGAKF